MSNPQTSGTGVPACPQRDSLHSDRRDACPTTPVLIVARGLRKLYTMGRSELEVLRGVDLTVQRGEALVIMGASGAGKSTLLHLLGGLDAPSSGDVSLDGADIYRMSSTERTRLRNEQIGGLKFRRQHPIGPYVVDFYCHGVGLVVEVDGDETSSHQ